MFISLAELSLCRELQHILLGTHLAPQTVASSRGAVALSVHLWPGPISPGEFMLPLLAACGGRVQGLGWGGWVQEALGSCLVSSSYCAPADRVALQAGCRWS